MQAPATIKSAGGGFGMAELANITIKGFRSIASITKLALGPINVLIGPNGSGKSNFIGAFSFLHAIREGRLQEYVQRAGGADRLLRFGAKITPSMELEVEFNNPDGTINGYKIQISPTDLDQLAPTRESLYYWDPEDLGPKHVAAQRLAPTPNYWDSEDLGPKHAVVLPPQGLEAEISTSRSKIAPYIRGHLDSWRLYHFHDTSSASALKKNAPINDNRGLRPDGSNLPAFLYYLRQKHHGTYNLIRGAVRQAAPFFNDFQLEPMRLDESKIRLEWLHEGTDDYFDVALFSDGTLRFIALATVLLQPTDLRPKMILIDEPELGLHPYAITLLASLIKQASTTSQVIVSTQSSLLLDHFEPEDVLVADRVNGATELRRLDSEELGDWLEDYSLGQLWEKNEIGGRPRSE